MPGVTDDNRPDDPIRRDAFDWLMRVNGAPGDGALARRRDAWLAESDARRRAYRSVERIWQLSGELPPDYAETIARSRRMAASVTNNGVSTAARRRPARPARRAPADRTSRRRYSVGIAAAAIAICLAVAFLPTLRLHLQADYTTGIAELRTVSLEDGSRVTLDADSAIAVNYGAPRREVLLLSGQAFFEVVHAPDRPFVVLTRDVATTVTGTAFSVRTSPEAVSVAVQSGSVEVAPSTDRSAGRRIFGRLAPGDRLTVDRRDGRVTRAAVTPDAVASWRERRLIVEDVPLGDVIDMLNRHYGGMIVLRSAALAERRVTGVFDLNHPVEALHAAVRTQRGSVLAVTPYLLIVSGS